MSYYKIIFICIFAGDVVNDTINKNFDAFLKELLPVIERSLAAVFLKISNSIVSPYTFDQLFPKN